MIKAIIFDCFGVLTTDLWKQFCDSLPEGVDVDRARELNRQYDAAMISRDQFLEEVHEITGHRPQEVEKLLGGEAAKNTKLLDYIRTLKKSYKIGLLSNIGSDWITDEFLTDEEAKLFDDMIFSHTVNLAKPDQRIFELAAERLDLPPAEIVFIDDSPGHVTAAQNLGMSGIVYEDFSSMKHALEAVLTQSE